MLEVYGLCTFSKFVAEMQQPLDIDGIDLEAQPFALPGTDIRKAIADGDNLRAQYANAIDVTCSTPPRHKRERSAWQTINNMSALDSHRKDMAKRAKGEPVDDEVLYIDRSGAGASSASSSESQESLIE